MPPAQCKPKPEGDKYGFTHFARQSCSGEGLDPLPSDSRRRGDRHALQVQSCALPALHLLCWSCSRDWGWTP